MKLYKEDVDTIVVPVCFVGGRDLKDHLDVWFPKHYMPSPSVFKSRTTSFNSELSGFLETLQEKQADQIAVYLKRLPFLLPALASLIGIYAAYRLRMPERSAHSRLSAIHPVRERDIWLRIARQHRCILILDKTHGFIMALHLKL